MLSIALQQEAHAGTTLVGSLGKRITDQQAQCTI
ncbi:hypothetical protein ARSEF1564_007638, partial [Beauveria bassiana]